MILDERRLLELVEEMKHAPEVYRLSPFWDKLAAIHLNQLKMSGFENFKRNVNLKYFHFSVLGIIRHKLHPVLWRWCRNPDWEVFKAKLPDYRSRRERGMQGFNAMTAAFYRLWVAMLWEYVSEGDPLGLLRTLNEPKIGNPFLIHYKGRSISGDLCNSVHEFYRAGADAAVDGRRWNVAELGAGYGRLAYVFLRALPSATYCILDVHPALLIAQQYLTEVFPDEKIFRFQRFHSYEDIQDEFESSRIRFLSANQIELIPPKQFDLFLNISSLHEMTFQQIENYLSQISRLCRGRFYTKQWRVSRATENGFVIKEKEYPVPDSWTAVYHRQHPLQRMFFEALYQVGDPGPAELPGVREKPWTSGTGIRSHQLVNLEVEREGLLASSVEPCRLCRSSNSELLLERVRDYITGELFKIRRCTHCGVAFTSPQPASMDRFYPQDYRRFGPPARLVLQFLYNRRAGAWVRTLGTPGKALEIGSGAGWMLRALRKHGWRVVGNERNVQSSVAALPKEGLPVFVGGLEAVRSNAQFDLIIMFQVLEHLVDPLTALRDCARLLAPRGVLVVAVPNLDSWQARLCGPFWFHLDVPRHLFHFTPASLARALDQAGLQVTSIGYRSFEHDPYGWIQSALNRMGFPNNQLTRLLMGLEDRRSTVFSSLAVLAASGVLLLPSIGLSLLSWMARSGALMQVWACKRNPGTCPAAASRNP